MPNRYQAKIADVIREDRRIYLVIVFLVNDQPVEEQKTMATQDPITEAYIEETLTTELNLFITRYANIQLLETTHLNHSITITQ